MNAPYDCFSIFDEVTFQRQALDVFRYQAKHVQVYSEYLQVLGVDPLTVSTWEEIPYLPVEFFKTRDIIERPLTPEIVFTSSGTTGQITSKHLVADLALYERSFMQCFELFYGPVSDYCILALLPGYLERTGSSLVFMAAELIRHSKHADSGFYLRQYADLSLLLKKLQQQGQKTILLGVTYALLDLAENFPIHFPELILMETGGMKGQRKELVRDQLHELLCNKFSVKKVHSEYGMTELLSQAYSKGDGRYFCSPWMRIRLREVNDPFAYVSYGQTGGVCITDLANFHSCSFIATQDLGRMHPDRSFEILGRFDQAELRGCNLMLG